MDFVKKHVVTIAASMAAVGVAAAVYHQHFHQNSAGEESHEKGDVENNVRSLEQCKDQVQASMSMAIACKKVAHDATVLPGSKIVHFIRHGEGTHNRAQIDWRANPSWDHKSEPYTLDTDPTFGYIDAELNEKGKAQAVQLQAATAALKPQLLVVSPMRRATLTGLLAFDHHVQQEGLPVLAHEDCHERAGKHTCDKRLPKTQLAALFPKVDYGLIEEEEDPFWGDGLTREPWGDTAARAARFAAWLMNRPEDRIAVAAHSAFLLSTFNAVFEVDDAATKKWFGTGEMRTVILTPKRKS